MFNWESMKGLKEGSGDRQAVKSLQNALHELGFDGELNWKKYGADGYYGPAGVAAVKAFAEKNGIEADGSEVSPEIADALFKRFDVLDDLRHLQNAVESGKIEALYRRGSAAAAAVVALQTLLNELGLGQELNWYESGADGFYGDRTAAAVRAFSEKEGMEGDGETLSREMAERIIERLAVYYGKDWDNDGGTVIETTVKTPAGELAVREAVEKKRTRLYVANEEKELRFTRFKKGVYFFGEKKPADFIAQNRDRLSQLPGLTDSAINVMIAVAENEGNMDSINTWDNSFMTFGMFQWTIGAGEGPGELPALLKKIKDHHPDLFEKYYGAHGLDIVDTGEVSGYFTLNGKKLVTQADKDILRGNEWSFYFSVSGRDPDIRAAQVSHAVSRLGTFYQKKSQAVKGSLISDLVTSEYGVGLILDNHVNRPGYVKKCLEAAMDETGLSGPENWTTDQERTLVESYLKIRETYGKYPMTDAKKRAGVTKKYLDEGVISDERGSFEYVG
ncbi:conserved hypothetical protein [Candidatus Desulfarcum epimagneticum]|uniref:Peptidoglycan binding-like domain-containing protein n=1 Tax=uncultured Desulfobacteraceae bacterium TaxID=218296 RepID=A0A484HDD2_9BACT|nr:conserved hypothetical protein [uncultured Desulfobacteraceae bacterium]